MDHFRGYEQPMRGCEPERRLDMPNSAVRVGEGNERYLHGEEPRSNMIPQNFFIHQPDKRQMANLGRQFEGMNLSQSRASEMGPERAPHQPVYAPPAVHQSFHYQARNERVEDPQLMHSSSSSYLELPYPDEAPMFHAQEESKEPYRRRPLDPNSRPKSAIPSQSRNDNLGKIFQLDDSR